jgi:site-specific recombinase XerC
VNQGISLYVVQGLLGHAHSRTTQRYAHLAHETLLEAAERVSDVVGGRNARQTGISPTSVDRPDQPEPIPT